MKTYTLTGADGRPYESTEKGALGGHAGTKVYGRLDCPVALSLLRRGFVPRRRVFFADVATAIAAGFRPCGACLREKYAVWKAHSPPRGASGGGARDRGPS